MENELWALITTISTTGVIIVGMMNKPDNVLRVRLDAPHWQMLNELCQTHDRALPDMVRKLIRDEHARMGKGEKQNGK